MRIRLKVNPYHVIAVSGTALVGVIAGVETILPNSARLTLSSQDADLMDFMPEHLRWGEFGSGWSGYFFSYQVMLGLAGILGLVIIMWNLRSLRRIVDLKRELIRAKRSSGKFRGASEYEEEIRSQLQRASQARESLVEPAVGAFFISISLWLTAVVVASKIDPEWSRPFLAPPMLVAQNLQRFGAEFLPAMLRSGWHMVQGVVIGSIFGILLGFFLSHVRWLKSWTAWHIAIISALPPFLLAEIFRQLVRSPWLPIVGVRNELAFKLAVAMASWAVLWPVLTATAHALAGIDPEYRRSIRLLGARTAWERIRYLELPFILRPVLSNLRVGFVIGLIVLLYAEGYGGPRDYPTLGYWFSDITSNFKLQVLWALLLFTSILVLIFEAAVKVIEWKLFAGRGNVRSSGTSELARSVVEERRNCLEQFEQARSKRWEVPPWKQTPWSATEKVFVVRGVRVAFKGILAFQVKDKDEISMDIGEFVSIIGRSGAGKSTFVKLLLGFEEGELSERGHLELGGIDIARLKNSSLFRPIENLVGYVAQRPVLLPHWTVEKNLLFGIRQQLKYTLAGSKKSGDSELFFFYQEYIGWLLGQETSVQEGGAKPADLADWNWLKDPPEVDRAFNSPLGLLVRFMGISDKMGSYPGELSGGEAQRVHLLRWLILGRPILVLDEAFSALDQPLKGMVRDAIHRHTKALGTSVINISHDRADVLQVSDRVLFVEDHRILEDASPRQLFFAPRTRDLAIFLGHTNLFEVDISDDPKTVIVKRDEYRDVLLRSPESLTFEQDVTAVHIDPADHEPSLETLENAQGEGRIRNILFIPSADVNVLSVENGHEWRGERAFRVESLRFTGTHYDLRLLKTQEDGAAFRIDAVVQDDDLISCLPPDIPSVEHLVGKRVEVSFVRGVILPREMQRERV